MVVLFIYTSAFDSGQVGPRKNGLISNTDIDKPLCHSIVVISKDTERSQCKKNRDKHFIKSMQLIFYYKKKFDFRNSSIDSNQIIQSIDINQKFMSEDNFNEQFTSFDLMDFLPDTAITVEQYQTNEQISVYQNNKKQEWIRKFFSPYDFNYEIIFFLVIF